MRISWLCVAVLGCLLFDSQRPVAEETASAPIKDWTILIYVAGDEESLHKPLIENLKRLEQTEGLTPDGPINVVLQHDDNGEDSNYRYALHKPTHPTTSDKLDTPPISEAAVRKMDPSFRYGERDSGSPITLKRFLSWAVKAYPARHYMLALIGHSWGLQGQMQDFYFDGKSRKPSSIIKNYELRRLLEEVYREQRAYIPEGRFDVLHIDACISGQLEIALELKEVFQYLIAHSVDTPYHGLAFDRVLAPFIELLRANPTVANQDAVTAAAAAHKLTEEHLLRPLVREYVEQYAPDGLMAKKEKEMSPLALFALRTSELAPVAAAVRELVLVLEDTGIGAAFRNGQRPDLDALRDSDDNADLLHLARFFKAEFTARGKSTGDAVWQRGIEKAQALEDSLSYHAPEVTSLLTPIRHPEARGAWIHIDVDGLTDDVDMLSCELLRLFRIQNQRAPQHLPQLIDVQGQPIPINNLECERVAEIARQKRPTILQKSTKTALNHVYDLKTRWPSGVDAFLSEENTANTRQRTLSMWIDRGKQAKLDTELLLQLPGTRSIVIEYVAGDPIAYLHKRPGAGRLLASEQKTVASHVVYTDPKMFARSDGSPGLYVAEAHTSGAYFKHGLGIFMRRDFPADSYRYQGGRLPIEQVEQSPYALSIEAYLNGNFKLSTGKILPLTRGVDCYRVHRIRATRWDEFLFGLAK